MPALPQVAINARAAARIEIGGVERLAREMALRLPALRPDRYRVIQPPVRLAHRAGHLWEQALLPALCARCALLYSPANLAPMAFPRNAETSRANGSRWGGVRAYWRDEGDQATATKATFGRLTLTLKKVQQAQPRRIEIH